jgi:Peptidase family S41
MKKIFVLLFLWVLPVSAQDCNCKDNFEWAKKTFEENDAGFQYIIDKKGAAEYQKHNEVFAEKVKTITTTEDCADAIYDWMKFFRDGHISVNVVEPEGQNTPQAAPVTRNDWEKYNITDKQFNKYLAKANPVSVEGIWKTPPYTIGIKKEGDGYIGFILDGGGTPWQKNQVKLRFKPNGKDTYSGEFYLRNYSTYENDDIKLLGNNTLLFGSFSLKRVNPKAEDTKEIKSYLELLQAQNAMVQQYSANTLVLRIPSFNGNLQGYIDSVLTANHEKIISTKNLVIDVRNNGGGSDGSYQEIIKYLYTNPIRIVGVQMLSTPLNNKRMESYLDYPDITDEDRDWVNGQLKKLNDNLGKFVDQNEEKVFIQTLDSVYAYPQNVAILINENDASTTEQFLLAAKQSTKVKLFGTTTAGMLDISNMNFVKSPCGTIEMGYCLSKSYRIPHMAIDGMGLQPDYYLDESIPDYEWVEYAEKTFSEK